jgi:hypothetical protein
MSNDILAAFRFLKADPLFGFSQWKAQGLDAKFNRFIFAYQQRDGSPSRDNHLEVSVARGPALPPIYERDVKSSFCSRAEDWAYSVIENHAADVAKKAELGFETDSNLMTVLLRLRQTCDSLCLVGSDFLDEVIIPHMAANDAETFRSAMEKRDPDHPWVGGSTKIKELLLPTIKAIPNSDKMIIFSYFAAALDLLQEVLRRHGLLKRCVRIDGSVPASERLGIQRLFNEEGSGKRILLMTTSVAEGMNLQGANHAVFLDPWWCPAVEEQAKRRIYRNGQTKPVFVYRFSVLRPDLENTVEQRVMQVREAKRQSDERFRKHVSDAGASAMSVAAQTSLSRGEMMYLLGNADGFAASRLSRSLIPPEDQDDAKSTQEVPWYEPEIPAIPVAGSEKCDHLEEQMPQDDDEKLPTLSPLFTELVSP